MASSGSQVRVTWPLVMISEGLRLQRGDHGLEGEGRQVHVAVLLHALGARTHGASDAVLAMRKLSDASIAGEISLLR
jgi:hypothetical protein